MVIGGQKEWLESLLSLYVSDQITLTLEEDATVLSFAGEARKIHVPKIPDLWETGAPSFGCGVIAGLPAPAADVDHETLLRGADNEGAAQGDVHLSYDIIGLAYHMLSRAEEIGRSDLDAHERFAARQSHAYDFGYLDRPLVDEWFYALRGVCQKTWPSIQLTKHAFSMIVSHDVDDASRYGYGSWKRFLRLVAQDFFAFRWKNLLFAIPSRLQNKKTIHAKDPYATYDWLMDVSEGCGIKSAFNFICGRTDPSKDALYDLGDNAIENLIAHIYGRGHEIGLHPSYETFQDEAQFQAEATRFKGALKSLAPSQQGFGGRMHYLRWSSPDTMRLWDDAGTLYDSTLGYADAAGFRCGTCHEYPAFDVVRQQMLSLKIRPLIAMEITFITDQYLGLGEGRKAYDAFMALKRKCMAVGGNFTLLWHNSRFESDRSRSLYEAVLKDC